MIGGRALRRAGAVLLCGLSACHGLMPFQDQPPRMLTVQFVRPAGGSELVVLRGDGDRVVVLAAGERPDFTALQDLLPIGPEHEIDELVLLVAPRLAEGAPLIPPALPLRIGRLHVPALAAAELERLSRALDALPVVARPDLVVVDIPASLAIPGFELRLHPTPVPAGDAPGAGRRLLADLRHGPSRIVLTPAAAGALDELRGALAELDDGAVALAGPLPAGVEGALAELPRLHDARRIVLCGAARAAGAPAAPGEDRIARLVRGRLLFLSDQAGLLQLDLPADDAVLEP